MLRLQALMNLSNINVRREKAGKEDGPIATDLKLVGKVHLADIKPLFLSDHGFAVLEGLYDSEGNLRSQDFDGFKLTRELTGAKAHLSTALGTPIDFDLANVDTFTVELELGRTVMMSLRLQVHPTADEVSKLTQWLASDITVILEQTQGELKLAGGTETQPAEAAAS